MMRPMGRFVFGASTSNRVSNPPSPHTDARAAGVFSPSPHTDARAAGVFSPSPFMERGGRQAGGEVKGGQQAGGEVRS